LAFSAVQFVFCFLAFPPLQLQRRIPPGFPPRLYHSGGTPHASRHANGTKIVIPAAVPGLPARSFGGSFVAQKSGHNDLEMQFQFEHGF
jgi:hypothetical protein